MLKSMYSGIAGMKVNQIKMDVIGNNIANVGTTAYKSSTARFSEMLSQNVKEASAPSQNKGGTNAAQIGLGVQLASISKVMAQGNMQATGRTLDVAIDGNGFFMVSNGPAITGDTTLEVNHTVGMHGINTNSLSSSGSQIMYSRDGAFTLDEQGNLLTSDGFRILGYSLTNDDNSTAASSKAPSTVNTAGLDITFGPGSQLNGYKVVLGNVGPNTVTSAELNKNNKTIVLNGDFSRAGATTAQIIETALNKGLSAAGISQIAYVSGTPLTIPDLASQQILNGADALSPNAVNIAGFNLSFSQGSELNGYSFNVNKISEGTPLTIAVDSTTKKITINGDFVTKGAITAQVLKDSINGALAAEGIGQSISAVSGIVSTLKNVSATVDSTGGDLSAINTGIEKSPNANGNTFAGLTFDFEDGEQLNGYRIKFGETASGNHKVNLNKTEKTIIISGDMADINAVDNIITAFNAELTRNGITTNKLASITGTFDKADVENILTLSGGSDLKAPNSVEILGTTITLPKGSAFNDVKFEIVDASADRLSVNYDKTTKTFAISGNFLTAGIVSSQDLANALNEAAQDSGDFGAIGGTNKIVAMGNLNAITGMSSNVVDGGMELEKPNSVQVNGMNIDFTAGGALNDYTIQIGTISAGTKTSATIDNSNKKIIINADLITNGAVTGTVIQNAINKALVEKGISQSVVVTGDPSTISGVESEATTGGTPVQSIDEEGILNFVDATKDVKAYDGALKTLKIPDKVKIPGTDTELRVTSYTIDKNGIITGVLEDGRITALGQIAMATFRNVEGLSSLGGNLYGQSINSGEAIVKSGIGTIADDNSAAYGDSVQGMLEMSNVDLAEEFTNMIVTSRAFQASSKMINTGDEMLQEIINLKR